MPWLTVWDNVTFGIRKKEKNRENISGIISTVGLEEFEKAYSTYLDSNGMDDFQNGLFGYMLDLYTADETWEISETEIMKDNDAYKFRVSMNVGDTPQEIQGGAEVNDGKIGNLDITEL